MPVRWIYDYETIVNCFVAVFEDMDSDDRKVFLIHDLRNDLQKYLDFLDDNIEKGDWHYGFNCNAFDAQITEYILENREDLLEMSTQEVIDAIFKYAQKTIEKSRAKEFPDYREERFTIKTVDIYKLNNWDANAKRASLKWVQFSMDWEDVHEMPYEHYRPLNNFNDFKAMIVHCINDVTSTKGIFNFKDKKGTMVMREQIQLRTELSEEYNVHLYSASEPRISKEVFLHFLSEKLGQPKRSIKNVRTHRKEVVIKDIILPYVKFETPEFRTALHWAKSLVIDIKEGEKEDDDGKGPKHELFWNGVKTVFGMGGLHGCNAPGVYKSGNGRIIVSADVKSFYPNLAIRNKWSPAHISQAVFCELYEWFYDERLKYDKKSSINYLFKIILNSTYGLSKNVYSFLYDPMFTYQITFNGQLLLSMLYEAILTRIPNATPIMQNTDGLEFLIDEGDQSLFKSICSEWEAQTSLVLEDTTYERMIVSDVNNYIAVYMDGKTKCKGRFEFEDLPLHKNKSFLVVPKALHEYFFHGTPIEDYLASNRNIFDYCGGVKTKGKWRMFAQQIIHGKIIEKKLRKITRYYVSEKGCKLVKRQMETMDEIQVQSGVWMQTIFNQATLKPWSDYDLNMKFYRQKIQNEIDKIETAAVTYIKPQLTLFG